VVAVNDAEAWAFLVARGRHKGHRTILVPDFLAKGGVPGLLSESVDGAAGSQPVSVNTPMGMVTVLSRTHRLTSRDVEGLVIDEHGRPLELLYGFVCRAAGIREAHEDDFKEALEQSLQAYRRFLANENRPFERSRAFPMRTRPSYVMAPSAIIPPASAERPARIPPDGLPPARPTSNNASGSMQHPPRRRMTVQSVAILGIATVFVLLAVVLLRGGSPVTEVYAEAPRNGVVDCSKPVSFTVQVRITTNDRARVSWEAGREGEKPTEQADLNFDRAETLTISVPVPDLRPRGGVIEGRYKVATHKPNTLNYSTEYHLRCAPGSE
jgi:hypothetical protein